MTINSLLKNALSPFSLREKVRMRGDSRRGGFETRPYQSFPRSAVGEGVFQRLNVLPKQFGFGMLLAALSLPVLAGGEDMLVSQCAACHNLTGPAPATVEALAARKGPDLFYAGNKYKAGWMERWLQQPQRIRPAGMYYPDHVKSGPKGDEIDTASLPVHPALSAADAKAVTAALMTRKGNSELIKAGAYKSGAIARNMGEMMFDKFKGCLSCHEIEPGYGGASGPEVYTAALRLQEDYLVSYLANPHAWDPKIFMPNKHLSEIDVQKFVHYFRLLGEEVKP